MPAKVKAVAYSLDWHLSGSDSFRKLLVDPLADSVEFDLRPWAAAARDPVPRDQTAVFCQVPPPKALLSAPDARLVWIPMWDQAHAYPQSWWNSLPSHLRILSLSRWVERRAGKAGPRTLRLKYFADPAALKPAVWNGDRVAFHWNRTGLLAPREVAGLCRAMSVAKLLFRDQLDPGVPRRRYYKLPARLGGTEVIPVHASSRDEFLSATESANIWIAPRALEGVGISLVEAMARGCCLVGYDAPALNEYVRDGENGLLFEPARPSHLQWLIRGRWLPHTLARRGPWRRFEGMDLARLGRRARLDHEEGHRRWLASLPQYERFVLDW